MMSMSTHCQCVLIHGSRWAEVEVVFGVPVAVMVARAVPLVTVETLTVGLEAVVGADATGVPAGCVAVSVVGSTPLATVWQKPLNHA